MVTCAIARQIINVVPTVSTRTASEFTAGSAIRFSYYAVTFREFLCIFLILFKGDLVYAYTWNIDNMPEQKEEYVLHLRIPDGADGAAVRVQTENRWKKADTEEDGSYVTVSVPYGAAFAVYSVQDNSVPIWLILAIAAAAVLAAVLIIKATKHGKNRVKKRREKRKKKKQQQTDSQ